MYIAFKCYDINENDSLNESDVKIILNSIPLVDVERLGEAVGYFNNEIQMSRGQYSK